MGRGLSKEGMSGWVVGGMDVRRGGPEGETAVDDGVCRGRGECVQGQFLPLTHQPPDGLPVDSLTWGLWEADVEESHPQRNKAAQK